MADQTIQAKIFIYDPSTDDEPRYETFEVPWKEYITGLEVLHYINENFKPIGYDYCCRSGLCGRCSCMVDGVPGLACWRVIQPGEHVFEPLKGFPVIRDLVVDHASVTQKMVESKVALETVNPITKLENIDHDLYWNTMEYLNMCKECMCCYAVCPPLQEDKKWDSFIGPAAMAQIGLRFLDPQDEGDRVQQAVISGLFDCTLCGECSKVCPAYIHHSDLFEQMQQAAIERGLKPA